MMRAHTLTKHSPPYHPRTQEDKALIAYVASHTSANGEIDWSEASIGGRISKQCRERWNGIVDPTLDRSA
jgi:hypothetical protein